MIGATYSSIFHADAQFGQPCEAAVLGGPAAHL